MLSVSHAGLRGELGPFPDGHRHVSDVPPISQTIKTSSNNGSSTGGDAFADAFESALSGFGSEIIGEVAIAVDGDDPLAAAFMSSGAGQIRTSKPDAVQQEPPALPKPSAPTPPPPPSDNSKNEVESKFIVNSLNKAVFTFSYTRRICSSGWSPKQ